MNFAEPPSPAPRPRAFHVMTKPIGPLCNLDCKYCFYLEKEKLFPANENFKMTDEVLENYIRQYIEAQDVPEIHFAWQGGEPTLLGVDFFRKVVALQKKYAAGKTIFNALQTNGTLLDDRWGAFLAENRFLVGLSLDGPAKLHDTYRVDKRGGASYARVIAGLRILKKHNVEFNTLTVVNRVNARKPLEVYRFLRDIGSGFLQFIPLVERLADAEAIRLGLDLATPPRVDEEGEKRLPVTDWSVEPRQYGEFLCTIFDEWVRHDVGRVFVQIFDVTLGNTVGQRGGLCVFSEKCGTALALEHNGDVFSCDHYVYPRFKLGNVLHQSLGDMVGSPAQRRFGSDKADTLPQYCRRCEVRHLCHGECPKHRFIRTPDGEPGLNYLCAAYKRFFTHTQPAMRRMGALLDAGRAPAEIMREIR
jgi:uncharacterized protein